MTAEVSAETSFSTLAEVAAERRRAYAKHGVASTEAMARLDGRRLAVLMEEVGEVARVISEFAMANRPGVRNIPDPEPYLQQIRGELIQVAAMAVAWADAIPAKGSADEVGPAPARDEAQA